MTFPILNISIFVIYNSVFSIYPYYHYQLQLSCNPDNIQYITNKDMSENNISIYQYIISWHILQYKYNNVMEYYIILEFDLYVVGFNIHDH